MQGSLVVPDPTLRGRSRTFLIAGACLLAALATEWALVRAVAPGQAAAVLAAAGSQALFGREAGIPIGVGAGGSSWLVFQFSVVQDIVEALLGYGLFLGVLAGQAARRTRLWGWFVRTRDAAGRRAGGARRWGGVGLFGFMLLPFMINGPLVGAVAGELGGLSRRVIATAIVAATAASAAIWMLLATLLVAVASGFAALLGAVSAGLAVAVLLAATLRKRRAVVAPV